MTGTGLSAFYVFSFNLCSHIMMYYYVPHLTVKENRDSERLMT